MPYVVVQQELSPPDKARYVQALTNAQVFTRPDVTIMGRHLSPILARNLPLPSAQAIEAALAGEGIASTVVEQSLVLPPPPRQRTMRMEISPDGLLILDATGQKSMLPWPAVIVIACGVVMKNEEQTEKIPLSDTLDPDSITRPGGKTLGRYTIAPYMYFDKHVDRQVTLLEVATQLERYQLIQDEASYDSGDQPVGRNARESFLILVRQIRAMATSAWINSGAAGLLQEPPQDVTYQNDRLFDDELAWLRWKAVQELAG